MVDMKAHYAKLKPELDAAFSRVMESMQLVEGPQVQSFARSLEQFLQVSHAFPCATGIDAARIALAALELPAGAEVVLPAFNDGAVAEVVLQLGLKPVFADVLSHTYTLDPVSVKQVITPATAAIVPTHLFGQCAEMEELMQLAETHGLWVLEDNTQSFGAVYVGTDGREKRAGSIGHLSLTAFFPPKPLAGMGEGGAVFTSSKALAGKIEKLLSGEKGNSFSKLETLQAAMLEVKIKYIDEYNEARQEVARFYDHAFAETPLVQAPQRSSNSSHTYHQYAITVPAHVRDGLKDHLWNNYIPSVIYYPQPLHLQEAFQELGYKPGDLPVAEQLSQSILSLPMHSELKQDQQAYICQHVRDFVKQHG